MLLIHKVYIICTYELNAQFARELYKFFVNCLLDFICFVVGILYSSLVELQFEVVVIAEDSLVPHYCLFCSLHIACYDCPWNLSGDAGRTAYQI